MKEAEHKAEIVRKQAELKAMHNKASEEYLRLEADLSAEKKMKEEKAEREAQLLKEINETK